MFGVIETSVTSQDTYLSDNCQAVDTFYLWYSIKKTEQQQQKKKELKKQNNMYKKTVIKKSLYNRYILKVYKHKPTLATSLYMAVKL